MQAKTIVESLKELLAEKEKRSKNSEILVLLEFALKKVDR